MSLTQIVRLLGPQAEDLLSHRCAGIASTHLCLPGPDFVDRVFSVSHRNPQVLKSLARLFDTGRLSGTGYLSILPVDQGIEHTAGASFAANTAYLDPEKLMTLAIEGGCSGVVMPIGALAMVCRRYAHKIPLIAKLNHNELLTYPNGFDQTLFGSVRAAWDLGATAVGATVYFGSAASRRQMAEVAEAFEQAHTWGMATLLWCYVRNSAFHCEGADYHTAADLTGQANHLGAALQADFVKQKLPQTQGGFKAIDFGKTHPAMYKEMSGEHPIDLCRYQVANAYAGRVGMISSGGSSSGETDLAEAVRVAVINKRAGGMGVIAGRKAFQKPIKEGVALLHAVQDVYLADEISVA